jgi:hypothetical protein
VPSYRVVDLDPRAANLYFLENPVSQLKAAAKLPFDPAKSNRSPPNVVEFHGGHFIFNGNHRIFALRYLNPSASSFIRVNLFSVDDFALYSGRSRQHVLHLIGRATRKPLLGP